MSGSLSHVGESTKAINRKTGPAFVALLFIAGLAAGLLSASLVYLVGSLSSEQHLFASYLFGGPLGATVGISLAACRILRGFSGFWKAVSLVFLSICAYFVSFWTAAGLELAYGKQSTEQTVPNFPLSMFAGGFVGGLLLLGGTFLLVHPKWWSRPVRFKVLYLSVLCGILGIVGWALGSSLGMVLWSALHAVGSIPPTETFQSATDSYRSRLLSLFVVWQTGTGFLLGLILQDRRTFQ